MRLGLPCKRLTRQNHKEKSQIIKKKIKIKTMMTKPCTKIIERN